MRIKIASKQMRVVGYFHYCEECGRQIDSYEYYTYGRCSNCRY